jgi:plasmid stabilization system protein ParE
VKVLFTEAAIISLERIGDFIAQDNPGRAETFIVELRDAALGLGEMPHAFPAVPRYERWGIRRRVHGQYLILYRVAHDHVLILLITHGARDYGKLLRPDEDT